MRRLYIPLAILAICLGSSSSRAAPSFSYDYVAGTPGQTTYTSSPGNYSIYTGDSLIIPIFLKETLNGGATASLLAAEDGLQGAGFRVSFSSSPNATTITNITANDTPGGSSFSFEKSGTVKDQPVGPSSNKSLLEGYFADPAVLPTAVSNNVYTVYLGNVTIAAGTSAGVTTLTADRRGMVTGNTTTVTHDYDVDSGGNSTNSAAAGAFGPSNSSTFTLTTLTPEPAGLGVLAVGAAALLRRRRRA